jgi:hypothetical protein
MKPATPSTRRPLPLPPKWMAPALQGLAFWIGHRRALYSDYPLGESALVAELCNLIHAHLDKALQLRCEVQYKDYGVKSEALGPLARMDLLISARPTVEGEDARPIVAIEVKRWSAPKAQKALDLRRLAALKLAKPSMRAFLVVVAEASMPKDFVNEDGEAITKSHAIDGTDFRYKVRRVLKASHTFKKERFGSAQYVCLIEVLPKPTPPPLVQQAKTPAKQRMPLKPGKPKKLETPLKPAKPGKTPGSR